MPVSMSKRKRESAGDVELYCAIRQCMMRGDEEGRERHLQQLSSSHARRCVLELLKTESLAKAFDRSLAIPGLRDGWSVSQWHKYSRYSEVFVPLLYLLTSQETDLLKMIISYVSRIVDDWERIVPFSDLRSHVDADTVKAIEGKCPSVFPSDATEIDSRFAGGWIFKQFNDEQRTIIKESLWSIDHRVPSLFTLLDDLKLLDLCARSISHIIPLRRMTDKSPSWSTRSSPSKGFFTVQMAVKDRFRGVRTGNKTLIETSEGSYLQCESPLRLQFEIAYRQLWIYALRNFTKLPKARYHGTRKLLARAGASTEHGGSIKKFTVFARKIGFQANTYATETTRLESEQQREIALVKGQPDEEGTTAARRSGIPYADTFERDRNHLFIINLHQKCTRNTDTSFFVLQSFYMAFFGTNAELDKALHAIPTESTMSVYSADDVASTSDGSECVAYSPDEIDERSQREEVDKRCRRNAGEWANVGSLETQDCDLDTHEYRADFTVHFRILQDGKLTLFRSEHVHPPEGENAARAASDLQQEGYCLFSVNGKAICPKLVLESALSSGIDTIIIQPQGNIDSGKRFLDAVEAFRNAQATSA